MLDVTRNGAMIDSIKGAKQMEATLTKSTIKHYCGSCRRGGDSRVEAVGFFTGWKFNPTTGRSMPWRGWLCEDHSDDLGAATDDLAELKLVKRP